MVSLYRCTVFFNAFLKFYITLRLNEVNWKVNYFESVIRFRNVVILIRFHNSTRKEGSLKLFMMLLE